MDGKENNEYYRKLLRRYIDHVAACEGIDFIDSQSYWEILSAEDRRELLKISQEPNEDSEGKF